MTEKLRSHLKSEKGFTLIELLVVIAIIAILVVIVLVAINPIQRLADSNDSRASANVHSVGTVIATCITSQLALTTPGTIEGCAVAAGANGYSQYGSVPTGVNVDPAAAAGDTDVCVTASGATNGATPHWYKYTYLTGTVAVNNGAIPNAATRCP